MKKPTQAILLLAFIITAPFAFAQAKKSEPAGAPTAATDPAKKSETKEEKKDAELKNPRPLPMNSRVDEIDPVAKTFTQNTRDGRKVKHVITSKTDIFQAGKSAKFEDIKVGDMVAGSRLKKNVEGSEYEVIKITKFGPKAKAEDKK
jgi:hypothetical protein